MLNIPSEIRRWVYIGVTLAILFFMFAVLAMCHAKDEASKARTETSVATSQAQAGRVSSDNESEQSEREKLGADVTAANAANSNGADNAKDTAGDAGRRGQLAYCERQRVRGKPLPEYCP